MLAAVAFVARLAPVGWRPKRNPKLFFLDLTPGTATVTVRPNRPLRLVLYPASDFDWYCTVRHSPVPLLWWILNSPR